MELLIGAVSIFINFWLLYWKFNNHRIADAVLDLTMMIILIVIFGGTVSGMSMAIAGGALISIGLLIFPPDLDRLFGTGPKPTSTTIYPDWYKL